MSYKFGTALVPGAYHYGGGGLGVLAESVPSGGTDGASYLFNDLDLPADNGKEVRGLIVTPPSAGTFFAFEDGSFEFTDAPDDEYPFVYRLYVDGVDLGTATGTITVGVMSSGTLSGAAALGDMLADGILGGGVPSSLSGSAALGSFTAGGSITGRVVFGSLSGSVRRHHQRRIISTQTRRR